MVLSEPSVKPMTSMIINSAAAETDHYSHMTTDKTNATIVHCTTTIALSPTSPTFSMYTRKEVETGTQNHVGYAGFQITRLLLLYNNTTLLSRL